MFEEQLLFNFSFNLIEEPNTPNNIFLIRSGATLLPYHKTSQFASRAFSKKSFTIVNDKQTANFSTTSSFVYRNITIKKDEKQSVFSKRLNWEADNVFAKVFINDDVSLLCQNKRSTRRQIFFFVAFYIL